MKRFFDIDSPLYKFMTTLMNVVVLNFCWLIGCLPIVTIGVSTTAAFDVGLRMVDNEEGYISKQFIAAYKKNLKQGVILGIMLLAAAYAVYLDFQFFHATEKMIFLMVGMLSAAIFFAAFVYAFPLAARYANSIPNILKNSFRISTRYFGRTFLLMLLIALEIFAFLWNSTLIFLGVLFGPSLVILTICLIAKPIFRKIEISNVENGYVPEGTYDSEHKTEDSIGEDSNDQTENI